MVTGYAVFANGGYRVAPELIMKVTESRGKPLYEAPAVTLDESRRAIDARNAFLMSSLLQEITRSGTAARAQAVLKRPDLYGKTGTTNDSMDAWFVGYQPTVAAAAWVGYDTPRNLGSRETGGGLSLPIWIAYMAEALKGVPVGDYAPPSGIINVGGEWYYEEYGPGQSVRGIGLRDPWPGAANAGSAGSEAGNSEAGADGPAMDSADRSSILDLFKN